MSKWVIARKIGVTLGLLALVFVSTYAIYLAGGGIAPSTEILSAMLIVTAFLFPLLFRILGNEKIDPGEKYAIAIGASLGISLPVAVIGLAFGVDSIFAAAIVVPFLILGVSLFLMAAKSGACLLYTSPSPRDRG